MLLYRPRDRKDSAAKILRLDYNPQRDLYELEVEWWDISNAGKPVSRHITERLQIPLRTWQEDWERLNLD